MSCGVSLENLKNFDKQIDEQASTLSKQIQQLESQLITAKNSYLKVLGAKEIIEIQIKEAESVESTPVLVPEASGD
tara:strand:- start:1410 stop:1637 length:228 start_codon:yes stop_codon:yes gene_type:complete